MSYSEQLKTLREYCGKIETPGLSDEKIASFAESDPRLVEAIDKAVSLHKKACNAGFADVLKLDERQQIEALQVGYVNFYQAATINPYVALSAIGPWIVTTCGAVIHDNGGYGMLGFGHNHPATLKALAEEQVMANIMTANVLQKTFRDTLQAEIGHARGGHCPYSHFLCMNSGSESVTVAARISDTNAARRTAPGGPDEGKEVMFLSLKGGFHGRTDRPSQASDSTAPAYRKHLKSFSGRDNLVTVEPNNLEELQQAFDKADRDNVFFEMVLMEPVMGEGNPGVGLTPEFYELTRKLTAERGTLLLIDSIQAGLRTHGVLSICDYPGFENLPAPDLETFSKALNGGQYPLSVLAMESDIAAIYAPGTYGNTMTTNPRALQVGCAILDSVDDELRRNVRDRGKQFLEGFRKLQAEFPDIVTGCEGTGLLCSIGVDPDKAKVVGFDGLEMTMRNHGIGVIHGGTNSLRFTPVFNITEKEVDLVLDELHRLFSNL